MRFFGIFLSLFIAGYFVSKPEIVVGAASAPAGGLDVTDSDGGSVVTDLGFKIKVNDGSTLHRHWIVINDPTAPVSLSGVGINTVYRSQSYGGEYEYVDVGHGLAKVPIQALEIRFMLFDVWGQHLKTLSLAEVRDFAPNQVIDLSEGGRVSWRTYENEVSEMLSVVCFVGSVRQADGTIWSMDAKKILGEVGRIKVKLSENDLTPEKLAPKQ